MVVTRSKAMAISAEIKKYFEELLKPLATSSNMNDLFESFKADVLQKFGQFENKIVNRIEAQDRKISELESTLVVSHNTINILSTRLDNVENISDNNEQYSRRSCLRIHGIEYKEVSDNVMEVLDSCYEQMKLPFDQSDIDRVHRIGKPTTRKDEGGEEVKTVKSIIVRFKSWDARQKFYKARPRSHQTKVQKPGTRSFNIVLDLTKRRYELLTYAKGVIEGNSKVSCAFADVNCTPAIKTSDNKFYYFNDKPKLHEILNKL